MDSKKKQSNKEAAIAQTIALLSYLAIVGGLFFALFLFITR